jgi:hypothetical protein
LPPVLSQASLCINANSPGSILLADQNFHLHIHKYDNGKVQKTEALHVRFEEDKEVSKIEMFCQQ